MDFNDSPEQAKFRLEVQNWLSKNAEHVFARDILVLRGDAVFQLDADDICT
jgi:hypothetical protein